MMIIYYTLHSAEHTIHLQTILCNSLLALLLTTVLITSFTDIQHVEVMVLYPLTLIALLKAFFGISHHSAFKSLGKSLDTASL